MARKRVPRANAPRASLPRVTVPRAKASRLRAGAVTIRMYCQGLGDCFLLSIPRQAGGKPFRILIDCGVLQGTPDDEARLSAVAGDLWKETQGQIDLLVVTHEHWDHISGFSLAQATFDKFRFEQVWLSWAENPKDAQARQVKSELGKKKAKVAAALRAVAGLRVGHEHDTLGLEATLQSSGQIMRFFGPESLPAAKGKPKQMTLGETMDWLRGKVRGNDFRQPGECLTLPGVLGVKVYVLGPPKSVKAIRKMDPTGDQGYRHLAASASLSGTIDWLIDPASGELPPGPFDACYSLSVEEARADSFFREHYGFADDPLGSSAAAWRRIDDDWLTAIGRLALQLDVGVNNTSLALAFELPDGRTLIFPGDAQIGNWLSWEAVKFKDPQGHELPVTAKQLLNRAVFYKVGHHGSHNATLRVGGLEEMNGADLVAMIPTDQAFAKTRKPPADGWKMPDKDLYEALQQHTAFRIARADYNEQETKKSLAGAADREAFLSHLRFAKQPLLPALKDQPLYVEYSLPK